MLAEQSPMHNVRMLEVDEPGPCLCMRYRAGRITLTANVTSCWRPYAMDLVLSFEQCDGRLMGLP
jgi:hypothetical protein